jgi:hypothetical protein
VTAQRLDALIAGGLLTRSGGLVGAKPGGSIGSPAFTDRASVTASSFDPDLQVPVDVGTYVIECHVIYSGANGAGFFKFTIFSPSGSEIEWFVPRYYNTANAPLDNETSIQAATKTAYTYGQPAANQAAVSIYGVAYIAGPGPLGLAWAQGASNATGTRVWSGSYFKATMVNATPTSTGGMAGFGPWTDWSGSLANGWGVRSGYTGAWARWCPGNSAMISLSLNRGTATDGTVIGTIPATDSAGNGLRPQQAMTVPVYSDELQIVTGSNNQGARVLVNSNGTVQCYGVASASAFIAVGGGWYSLDSM